MRREEQLNIKTKSPEQALAALMRYCAKAERSSGDAMRLMARWGVESTAREAILERLVADKFIDDSRFAEAYVREKLNLSGWGARKIASSLRVKGVASSTIEAALSQVDSEAMQSRLNEKLRRKLNSVKYTTIYELKGKLFRYGLSLGYDYDMVQSAVPQIIENYEE